MRWSTRSMIRSGGPQRRRGAEAQRRTGSQPLLHQRGKEIQRFGELRLLPIALAHDARAQSCQLLNQILADSIILYNLYKKHHWLVRGPTFYQLHLLLDKHAEEQLKLIDLLGERVQTLGGVAIADPRHVAEVTAVPRPPDGVEEVPAMLSRLLEAHEIVIEKVRDAIAATAGNQAQTEMEQAITALGTNGFQGVYAANDGTAGGAIAAMNGQGIDPSSRPVTGQDAELAAVQRILTGQQYMTAYKAIKPEAGQAAELAVDLVNGNRSAADSLAKQKTNNGQKDVASIILTPVAVTKANARQTISRMISDGFLKAADICSGPAASACHQLGLSQ